MNGFWRPSWGCWALAVCSALLRCPATRHGALPGRTCRASGGRTPWSAICLRTAIKASLKIYLPVLAGAVIVGAYMIAEGSPFGVTVILCFGAPPILAVIRAVRVLRYLDETA